MTDQWKQEHRFLYNADGSPTKELERLREAAEEPKDNPPQGDDPTNKFPTVQVSDAANNMINRLINAAAVLGRVDPLNEGDDFKVRVLYGCLGDARRDLYKYIEALEYAAGIERTITKRFD